MDTNKKIKCICEDTDGYFQCGVKGVLAHVENGKIIGTVERCDLCCTFESDLAADRHLRWVLKRNAIANKGK